jgi:hypothetical protein
MVRVPVPDLFSLLSFIFFDIYLDEVSDAKLWTFSLCHESFGTSFHKPLLLVVYVAVLLHVVLVSVTYFTSRHVTFM